MNFFPLAFGFGNPTEWLIILGIVVVLFGGKKIPELARGLGRGVGELQKGLEEGKTTLHAAINSEADKNEAEKAQKLAEAKAEVARLESEEGVKSEVTTTASTVTSTHA